MIKNLFDIKSLNKLEPKTGRVLIASPFLRDPYFLRSVIYLCSVSEESTMGLILNSSMSNFTKKSINNLPLKMIVSLGGPVSKASLFIIHKNSTLQPNIPIIDKIYLGGNIEEALDLIVSGQINSNEIRFFYGYTGWTHLQLKEEIAEGSWIVARTTSDIIWHPETKNLWKEVLTSMGAKYAKLTNFPEIPEMN